MTSRGSLRVLKDNANSERGTKLLAVEPLDNEVSCDVCRDAHQEVSKQHTRPLLSIAGIGGGNV